MARFLATTGVALAMVGQAYAGGIERDPQSVSILFEEGNYAEGRLSFVSPSVSGTDAGLGGPIASGDMAPSYFNAAVGYKQDISDNLAFAVIIDQPVGADVDYATGTGYPLAGTMAELTSIGVTAFLKYRFDNNVSIYGGPRLQSINAELSGLLLPPPTSTTFGLDVDRTYEFGYAVGVGYEMPEIALRVALTYNSAIDHTFDSSESFGGAPGIAGSFTTTIPQSVNLEFQSGIAENTLVFGNIRWQDWSEFDITPPNLGSPLIAYQSDYITYNLGIGRRFNDQWSGAVTVGYEAETGDIQGNLAPRDGFASIGVAATYTMDNVEITGGIRYIALGDATTQTIDATFTDNDAIAAGIRVGMSF